MNQIASLFNQGNNELSNGNILKAINFYEKVLSIEKKNEKTLNNIAYAYFLLEDYNRSENYILEAIKLNKENQYSYFNLGNLYKRIGRLDDSLQNYDKALAIESTNKNFLYNKGHILLKQKKYETAWDFYENRIFTNKFEENLKNNLKNEIVLSENIFKENKLAIIGEQGLGDQILYSSMYSHLLDFNCEVKFINDLRLNDIFKRTFKEFEFIDKKNYSAIKKLINNNYKFIFSASLGKYFRKDIKNFSGEPYLIINNVKANKYKKILSKYNFKKLIGISWKSSRADVGNKSIELNNLQKIFDNKDFGFINLQYGENNDLKKYNQIKNNRIIEIDDINLFNEIDDVISLISCLDLVITTPNVNVHFSGAIGKKCLVISPLYNELFLYSDINNGECEWYKNQKNIIVQNNLDIILKNIYRYF